MGIDWETILDAEGEDLSDAWESAVYDAEQSVFLYQEDNNDYYHPSNRCDRITERAGSYIRGMWKGKQVRFKTSWGGHTFSDAEARSLMSGANINFTYTTQAGISYRATGHLQHRTYKDIPFVGFKVVQQERENFSLEKEETHSEDKSPVFW